MAVVPINRRQAADINVQIHVVHGTSDHREFKMTETTSRHSYWIGVACQDHVKRGVAGGFAQLGHGKESAVKILRKGDWIAYYSPRTALDGGKSLQAFTGIGQVISEKAYQVDNGNGFKPFRVDVAFESDARDAEIRPLLDRLDLTKLLGRNWGGAFRYGRVKVNRADFRTIAAAMGVEIIA